MKIVRKLGWKVFLAGCVLALTWGPAAAAQGAARGTCPLGEADTDGDGAVSFEEFSAYCPDPSQAKFDRLDRNSDGVLSSADRPAGPGAGSGPGRGGRMGDFRAKFKEADANSDGQVTYDELRAVLPNVDQGHFAHLDRNGDGVLSRADAPLGPGPQDGPGAGILGRIRQADSDNNGEVTYEELAAVMPNLTQESFARFDRNGDGKITRDDRPGGRGTPAGRGPRGGRLLEADANGDKQVTYDELTAIRPGLPREVFDRLDRNGDGVLTDADRPAAMQ